jgi:uncharacterized protein involved in type VI secretion and phage assembly
VINNCDLIKQGKVLVRIAALDQEVWARLSSPGAGSGAGFFYVPRTDDEVLVALNDNDPTDAFVIGGLWNTQDSPPVSDQLQAMTKRVIKTGLIAGLGHEVEFDDGPGQSITITTTTQQKIMLDKEKIEISTTGGQVKVTLDFTKQAITIQALSSIEIKAVGTLKLSAAKVEIAGKTQTTITGGIVMIN